MNINWFNIIIAVIIKTPTFLKGFYYSYRVEVQDSNLRPPAPKAGWISCLMLLNQSFIPSNDFNEPVRIPIAIAPITA